jgi:putative redox protein
LIRTVIVEDGASPYLQTVSIGPHMFQSDEQIEAGGNDEGPDPYELLLAALGTCVSITLRMYANRKRWLLKAIRVELLWARFSSNDDLDSIFVDGIEMELSLTGDLSKEQRERLSEIASKCPVHRTLSAPLKIQTKTTVNERPTQADFVAAS